LNLILSVGFSFALKVERRGLLKQYKNKKMSKQIKAPIDLQMKAFEIVSNKFYKFKGDVDKEIRQALVKEYGKLGVYHMFDKLKTGKMGIGGLYKFCKVAGLNPMIVFDDEI